MSKPIPTCEDLEGNETDGPHVRRALETRLLRTLLDGSANLGRGVAATGDVFELNRVAGGRGRVEIHELPREVCSEPHDVRGIQVAVDDPLRVELRNSLQNLNSPTGATSTALEIERRTESTSACCSTADGRLRSNLCASVKAPASKTRHGGKPSLCGNVSISLTNTSRARTSSERDVTVAG